MTSTNSANQAAIIQRYALISADHSDISKGPQPKLSAYVIRLTDASVKALNEAVADQKREKSKAKLGYVAFHSNGNEGTLSFGGSAKTEHRFSMLDAQRDLGPTGQLEAIVEINAKSISGDGGGRMKSIGAITKRVHISATTQDTFESTKQKAKRANEEIRKNAAKVLKTPTGGGRKKVWDKISKVQNSTLQRPLTPLSHGHRGQPPAASTRTIPISMIAKKNAPISKTIALSKSAPSTTHSSANESMDDADEGTQRVRKKVAYRAPPPKRAGIADGSKSQQPTPASVSPSTAAAIDAVSAVTLSDFEEQPTARKRIAFDRRRENGPEDISSAIIAKLEAQYPPVRTVDERRRYKEEFDRDYPLYMEGFRRLRQLVLEFEQYEAKMKAAPKSTPERKQVGKEIMEKYKEFEGSVEIKKLRKDHKELELKLNILKTRVKAFDDKVVVT